MNPAETYAVRNFVMERVHHYAQESLPAEVLESVGVDVFELLDDTARDLVLRMEAHVYAEQRVKLSRDVEFRVPATWWDHFKLHNFPGWAYRRWPCEWEIVKRTATFAEYLTYPDADLSHVPGLGAPVRVQTSVVE